MVDRPGKLSTLSLSFILVCPILSLVSSSKLWRIDLVYASAGLRKNSNSASINLWFEPNGNNIAIVTCFINFTIMLTIPIYSILRKNYSQLRHPRRRIPSSFACGANFNGLETSQRWVGFALHCTLDAGGGAFVLWRHERLGGTALFMIW